MNRPCALIAGLISSALRERLVDAVIRTLVPHELERVQGAV